jgi:hypothetical protein
MECRQSWRALASTRRSSRLDNGFPDVRYRRRRPRGWIPTIGWDFDHAGGFEEPWNSPLLIDALRTLILCVEHALLSSVRSPEFPGKPPYGSRFHGVTRNHLVLYGVALGTFEPAVLKAHGPCASSRQHHARRAAGTARALNWSERRAEGKISLWHDTSLHLGGSVQHSQSPINAEGGSVIQPLWNLRSTAAAQYCSLAQIKISYPQHDLSRSKHSHFSN